MIARFVALLPFDLLVRQGDGFPVLDFATDGYRVKFYTPSMFAERPILTDSVLTPIRSLTTAKDATFTDALLVDGQRTAMVNVLVMDFMKPEFNRPDPAIAGSEATGPITDPPKEFAIEIANLILARIRVYSRAFQIKPIEAGRDPWHIQYLTDDQQMLEMEEGKVRFLTGAQRVVGFAALKPEFIQMLVDQKETGEPYVWDHLLLDSFEQLPDIGGAIVMASAALESFISWALNILEREQPLAGNMWTWINKRDHWTKEPSVTEKYDVLLRVFTQRSLRDEKRLWQCFGELKKARNSLVHEGVARIGQDAVTPRKARELVDGAADIIKWVELLLPERFHRARTDAIGPFSRRFATVDEFPVRGASGLHFRADEQNRGELRVRLNEEQKR